VWSKADDRRYGETGHSRRAVLRTTAGAVVGIAGATGLSGCGLLSDPRTPDRPDPLDPLDPLLAGAWALATQYDAAIAAWPDLAARLTPIRDAHRAHAAALAQLIGRPNHTPVPSAGSSTGPPSSPGPTSSAEPPPSAEPTSSGGPTESTRPTESTGPTASTGPTGPTGPTASTGPSTARATLASLRAAEQTAQDEAASACLSAVAARTRLLGSVTAARASHRETLQ
jgi:hypothetical protein